MDRSFLRWRRLLLQIAAAFLAMIAVYTDVPAGQKASYAEVLQGYNYILEYTKSGNRNEVFSKWAYDNRGRLNWIMMRNNRDPIKTGSALLELDTYCNAFLAGVLSVDWDRESSSIMLDDLFEKLTKLKVSEELNTVISDFVASNGGEMPDTPSGIHILLEKAGLSEEDPEELIGTDILFGFCCLDEVAGKKYADKNLREEEKQTLLETWLWIKTVSYTMMLELSDQTSDQYCFLQNQLQALRNLEKGEITEAESFSEFLREKNETDGSEEEFPGKLPFVIYNYTKSDNSSNPGTDVEK